ncbi:MAG TPA: hypothetical protein VK327_17635 [Candidatus Paceibacterota bacterium]|nr:hypothetical protein [Candidatus Paceibacterota bacterium]
MKIRSVLAAVVFGGLLTANATSINLYVDAAPNVYGSPNYASWWSDAKAQVSAGTFVNMQHSSNPANAGSTRFEITDSVVYSFGDLGKRLHFVYWIPGESVASLTAKNFQIGMSYQWGGVTYDFYQEYYGTTWLTPGSWIDYNGGVIGSAGFAWWGAYGTNTQAALDQDLSDWDPLQGNITFTARENDGTTASITALHGVPDGGTTFGLLFAGCSLIGILRRRTA